MDVRDKQSAYNAIQYVACRCIQILDFLRGTFDDAVQTNRANQCGAWLRAS